MSGVILQVRALSSSPISMYAAWKMMLSELPLSTRILFTRQFATVSDMTRAPWCVAVLGVPSAILRGCVAYTADFRTALYEMIRPLIVVYGEWLFKDNCWDFVVDNVKGARMCFLSDSATHADLVEMAEEDYKLDMNREVVDFTYSSPEEMMQQMAPDTPPIHVTSDRQVQNLIEICKTHDSQLRDKKKIMKMVMKSQIREKKKIMKMVMKRRRRLMSQFGEVDEDDFVDYSVYGKVKDEDVDEVEADDMCFEGFKALYASEGGSSNMAFSDNIYVNQSFVSREALVSELWLTALKLKFSFKLYKVTKTLVVAKCRVAGCGWKLRAGGKRNCIVDLQQIKGDCGVNGIEKIPCSHAIAAETFAKLHIASLVSLLYSRENLYTGYSQNIYPCAGEVEIRKCLPPEVQSGPGRQKKSRWQSWLELSRFRGHKPRKLHKDYRCSNCKQPGHTRPNCNQPVL
ncbi:hypothetical protein DY000_02030653 [Brassica cretica]|uniref:Transposase MuDR plant domain-containing protein n=1 Tax=Brassica cretica TaxID=69181 RepID=A0ABQ7E0C4_BRACR|nr:hypothetical protein DY000_02030653 [Brassica cretica]